MDLSSVFNVTLHVPSLRTDEIIRVLRETSAFEVRDLPGAVERLTSICGKEIPLKKLLLWLEMARQEVAPAQRISLERWEQTLQDLSS
jgi:vesicle-fusing ATPase